MNFLFYSLILFPIIGIVRHQAELPLSISSSIFLPLTAYLKAILRRGFLKTLSIKPLAEKTPINLVVHILEAGATEIGRNVTENSTYIDCNGIPGVDKLVVVS